MDPEKRKREDDDDETETVAMKRSTKPDEGEHAVREEEVEEFFAILRRMHVAVKYFQKADGDGSGRKLTARMKTWKPSFEVEDFEGVNGARDDGNDETRTTTRN